MTIFEGRGGRTSLIRRRLLFGPRSPKNRMYVASRRKARQDENAKKARKTAYPAQAFAGAVRRAARSSARRAQLDGLSATFPALPGGIGLSGSAKLV